jgi:hypothetical protein
MAFYMIGGLIFTSEGLLNDQEAVTTWILLLSTLVFIAFAITLWLRKIMTAWTDRRNQTLIRDYTVGVWIKATVAMRLNLPTPEDFFALIGGRHQKSLSATRLADAARAVGIDKWLGDDAVGELLLLLLDRDHNEIVPAQEACENLYQGFGIEGPEDLGALNEEVMLCPLGPPDPAS